MPGNIVQTLATLWFPANEICYAVVISFGRCIRDQELKMKTRNLASILLVLLALLSAGVAQSRAVLPAGTEIKLRTDQAISATSQNAGRMVPATVSQDITDANGQVAVPSGSRAQLSVSRVPSSKDVTLDLRSLTVGGNRYLISAGSISRSGGKEGIGKNKRTGEYVGGGALAGTIIGAIAGGGRRGDRCFSWRRGRCRCSDRNSRLNPEHSSRDATLFQARAGRPAFERNEDDASTTTATSAVIDHRRGSGTFRHG
jgi:hypothetical protein